MSAPSTAQESAIATIRKTITFTAQNDHWIKRQVTDGLKAPSVFRIHMTKWGPELRVIVLGLAIALAVTTSAQASGSCAALVVKQTAASRADDASLVARLGKQSVTASDIGPVMIDGPWRLVWATPQDAERGVYFFRRGSKRGLRLIDIWGGVLPPDERQEGVNWARNLRGGGPSVRLSECFANAVVAGN